MAVEASQVHLNRCAVCSRWCAAALVVFYYRQGIGGYKVYARLCFEHGWDVIRSLGQADQVAPCGD